MVEGSGSSGGDKGYGDGFANGAGQFEIITIFGTVRIHAGEEDFSGAKADGFAGPFEDINAGGGASSMGVDFPLVGVLGAALGVDGNDDALITEAEAASIKAGLLTAAVLRLTLSAPALSISRISLTTRRPPPTVSGMKHSEAVRSTTSCMIPRSSLDAVMSKKTSSSAPCCS